MVGLTDPGYQENTGFSLYNEGGEEHIWHPSGPLRQLSVIFTHI